MALKISDLKRNVFCLTPERTVQWTSLWRNLHFSNTLQLGRDWTSFSFEIHLFLKPEISCCPTSVHGNLCCKVVKRPELSVAKRRKRFRFWNSDGLGSLFCNARFSTFSAFPNKDQLYFWAFALNFTSPFKNKSPDKRSSCPWIGIYLFQNYIE